MTDAPDGHSWTVPIVIYAKPNYDEWVIGGWDTHGKSGGTQYARADLIPAMLQAAREEGARAMREAAAVEASKRSGSYGKAREITEAIRAIDPKEVVK